jgi:peptidoglycan hydrolase-like protein with peptidoglycan-binding domain
MAAITRSVGQGGVNAPADVSEIQRLLNAAPAAQGGATPPLSVDGICGGLTQAAILRFQKSQAPAFADGRIDPGGPTLARLNALAVTPGSAFAAGATGSLSDVTRARGLGLAWLSAVEPAITGFMFSVGKKLTPAQAPSLAFIEDAFHKHFKLILDASKKTPAHPNVKVFNPVTDAVFIPTIRANFRAIFGVVSNPAKFELITETAAKADGAVDLKGNISPAYVKGFGTNVKVTPAFNSPARGPNCQAAMVVHEATHVIDGTSGDPPRHIYEWASNDPPISGKFGDAGYDRQTPEDAVHNASAYASFAAHVARGRDERFGDGRRTE